jgi:hypothetical protein
VSLRFELAELAAPERYKLLGGLVVPRPIALVTSLSADGGINAAPFSFFNVFAEEPGSASTRRAAPRTPRSTSATPARSWSIWSTKRSPKP